MSNLKKLKLIAYRHVLVSKFLGNPIEEFYELKTVEFKGKLKVTNSTLANCVISMYNALRTYQKSIGENQIYMDVFEIIEIVDIKHTAKELWQKRKNFR